MPLWKTVACPACRTPGARKFLWLVRCPDRLCPNYDPRLAPADEPADGGAAIVGERPPDSGRTARSLAATESSTSAAGAVRERLPNVYDPPLLDPAFEVEIRYRNFRDEEKYFTGDRRTLRRRNNHLSLRLAPSGQRCAFSRDRILNLAAVEPQISAEEFLSPTERRVLNWHRRRGTTSAQYEAVLRKLEQHGQSPS